MGALGTKTDSAQLPFSNLPKVTGSTDTPGGDTGRTLGGEQLPAPLRTGRDGTGQGKARARRNDCQTRVFIGRSC